jgi:hypothetical protein
MERCPCEFADLSFAELRRATGNKAGNPKPPRARVRPRSYGEFLGKTTAPVTVYDRDAGVGELPENLR